MCCIESIYKYGNTFCCWLKADKKGKTKLNNMDFRQRKMHAPVVIKSLLFIYDFYIAGVVAQQSRRWFEYFRKEQFTSETTKPKMV